MLWFKQLDLFRSSAIAIPPRVERRQEKARADNRDSSLEEKARELLHSLGASALAPAIRVEWNSRLRSAAGRADFRRCLISLNPRLREHGTAEIDRTFRHELAHLLAHARSGRRRIQAHGREWRLACGDLGIANEERCHSLPFPTQKRARPFLYCCASCAKDFPRVRPFRRGTACLECCRRHNRGRYSKRFELRLVQSDTQT